MWVCVCVCQAFVLRAGRQHVLDQIHQYLPPHFLHASQSLSYPLPLSVCRPPPPPNHHHHTYLPTSLALCPSLSILSLPLPLPPAPPSLLHGLVCCHVMVMCWSWSYLCGRHRNADGAFICKSFCALSLVVSWSVGWLVSDCSSSILMYLFLFFCFLEICFLKY